MGSTRHLERIGFFTHSGRLPTEAGRDTWPLQHRLNICSGEVTRLRTLFRRSAERTLKRLAVEVGIDSIDVHLPLARRTDFRWEVFETGEYRSVDGVRHRRRHMHLYLRRPWTDWAELPPETGPTTDAQRALLDEMGDALAPDWPAVADALEIVWDDWTAARFCNVEKQSRLLDFGRRGKHAICYVERVEAGELRLLRARRPLAEAIDGPLIWRTPEGSFSMGGWELGIVFDPPTPEEDRLRFVINNVGWDVRPWDGTREITEDQSFWEPYEDGSYPVPQVKERLQDRNRAWHEWRISGGLRALAHKADPSIPCLPGGDLASRVWS